LLFWGAVSEAIQTRMHCFVIRGGISPRWDHCLSSK